MAPYYAAGGVTLYHGECREILPSIDRPCAIVTDPPYGTGWVRGSGAVGVFNATREQPAWDVWSTDWLWLPPDVQAHAVFAPLSRAADLRSALGTPSAVAHWRKTNPRPNGPDRDAIVIRPAYLPDGIEFRAYNGDTPLHPCQKPLDLMQWVLGFVPPELLVVDPFAGSGTTLEAARNIGREAVGIEANEAYCATIVERLSQGVLALEVPA